MRGSLKEKQLLYRVCVKHDPEAFAELYDVYVRPIYRFVYLKLSNKEDAEDVTSDIFLKAWHYLLKSQEEDKTVDNFRGLIYTIARNRIIDIYRDRARRQECPIHTVEEIIVSAGPIQELEYQEERGELLNTLRKMKQEYQDVIYLRYIEGLRMREIASILGKSSTSVRVTLHRAMKKLKELKEGEKKEHGNG